VSSEYRRSCAVDGDGIAHVFTPFVVGASCACGRAVAALSDDERAVVIRRSSPRPRPAPAKAVDSERLLALGGAAIAAARAVHARVAAGRAEVREGRRRRAAARAGRVAIGPHAS